MLRDSPRPAASSRIISTSAATAIANAMSSRPAPIRCSCDGSPLARDKLLSMGTITELYMRTHARTQSTSKDTIDAGGMVNDMIRMFIAAPCCTNVVFSCAYAAESTILVAHIGNSRSRILSSSTCVTVQILHEASAATSFDSSSKSDSMTTAALSRKPNWSVVRGDTESCLPARGNHDLREALDRRACGHAALVHGRGEHEAAEGERDAGRGDAEAKSPANVLLDPHDEKARHDHPEVDADVEPAEEGHLALAVGRVVIVELVRAERQQRRAHTAASERHEVEPEEGDDDGLQS
ncbi:Os04g0597816 [Oryza sativa Japonica Group]|uniref:Os04g0597816 protein n=1 Tax=Oryza sativa subsp. japonica TaxID=39947 RepID=A0A0P0WEI2_ORYSJ|nr:hypothetical protein EE612_025327 [Oryza sativa]BAS90806.1 Os04g0597816 [Oryza sativa Japonica Group]